MSSPDLTDERFDEIVHELREARPEAPAVLRERVREIAARPVAPRPARRRRLGWVLAPAAAAAVAGAVAIAVLAPGDPGRDAVVTDALRAMPEAVDTGLGAASKAPVAPGERAQLYSADITLRVKDISGATQRALRITRSLDGYVRSLDYGEGTSRGTARLVLRVPIARVQGAIVRYSQLGTILEQHVSVRDVQGRLDRRFARIAELRRTIPALAGDELATAQAELETLLARQARDRRQVSFATVSLALTTRDEAVVVSPPGRIERAFTRAVDVLEAEAVAVVYATVVAAPFLLLGLALVLGARAARRRSDERLLA